MTGELFRDQAPRSQPLAVPGARHLVDEPSDATTDRSANCEIIPDRVTDCRRRQWLHVNESNPKLLDLQSALAEMQRLREENVRLRGLLQEHGIQIPAVQSTTVIPVTTNALPSAHISVLKAEQRIALFRSLFHGRDDVYAVRWENTDGRSGYMPRADRDWKAYLRAKDEDRRKVDRQTRKFRLLTDEVVRGHLVEITPSAFIRCCRMRPAGFSRSISTRKHGKGMPLRFWPYAAN
jgi:hypothetical protein